MNRIVYTFFAHNEVHLPKLGRLRKYNMNQQSGCSIHTIVLFYFKSLLDKLSVIDAH